MTEKHYTSVTPTLWTRKDKTGKYPIKIRVTTNRKSVYHNLGYSVSKLEWSESKRRVKSTHPESEEINFVIEQTIKKIENNQQKFIKPSKYNKSNILEYIKNTISKNDKNNKYHLRKRYNTLLQHLIGFWGNENLHFYDVNPEFIYDFRTYLEVNIKPQGNNKEASHNTINNYLKVLRAIINRSIDEGIYFGESPFKRGHIPKKTTTPKITLTKDDIWALDNIYQHTDKMTEGMWDAINVFLFCFWSQGIRIGDCLQLRYGDLNDDFFSIKMDKTGRKHHFPLTNNNLYRIIPLIDSLPPLYNWEKKEYNTPTLQESNYRGKKKYNLKYPKNYPTELSDEKNILNSFTLLQTNREILYNGIKKWLDTKNQIRKKESKADALLNNEYKLYDREFFMMMVKEKDSKTEDNFKKYDESKKIYLQLGREYLLKYAATKSNQNKFIFPFLKGFEDNNGIARWNKISSVTALINKNLKKVSETFGIKNFSTHYARHTFTSLSKEMGADIYDLKQWLGHTSVKTTEGYVNSVGVINSVRHNEKMDKFLNS